MTTRRNLALAVKRGIDLLGAGAGLLVLSPLLAVTALVLLAQQGRPIFFRHVRPGLGGRPFTLVKLRTMRRLHPGELPYRSDAQRVTRLGRLLRCTSVDELPELWNVLRGEMSLVGPRPLLIEYLDHYSPEEHRRHVMLPGITGWAQVNGRHAIKFRERLKLDVWYVEHWSLWLDLKILAMTVHQVLSRRDVLVVQGPEPGFPLPGAEAQSARSETGQARGRAAERA